MECRYCQKAFHKGEHLRRHEQSHTGSKPYVCKHCKRPFSRQDSLLRHEKLHTRSVNNRTAVSTGNWPVEVPAHSVPDVGKTVTSASVPDHGHMLPANGGFQVRSPPTGELDFELMWPDSADLFETLMSQDAANQWNMPLGMLPFPDELPQMGYDAYPTPSSVDDRVSSIGAIPSGGNREAVHDVSRMISNLSSNVTDAVEATSISSVFLDECLHMFFVRFIPTFPVLHRASFVFRECTHPLLLNAIAIGSLYLGPKTSIAKGEALWRLAHTAVSTGWQSLITHRGPYDACSGVQLVITALLSQVYGALSKNQLIRNMSQPFRSLGLFWARDCGMFESEPFQLDPFPSLDAPEEEKEHRWRLWIAREIQQRTLLAHYMVDGLVSQMSGAPTSVFHAANQLGPPSSDSAWNAGTADEWILRMPSQATHQLSFRSIIRMLFSPAPNMTSLNSYTFTAFSLRVLLEGIQSFISNCSEWDDPVAGIPSKQEVQTALACIHEWITRAINITPADKLETLLRWHAICIDAIVDSSLLCKQVCARYKTEQHVWPDSKRTESAAVLMDWATTKDARRTLLHAVAIQDIVEELPRGRAHAIHMPSSLFAAATVYSVFSLADIVTVRLVSNVDWNVVLSSTDAPSDFACETSTYLEGNAMSSAVAGTTRNLVYELNSMQKLFRCLSTQWGIASDMEKVVEQWVDLCH